MFHSLPRQYLYTAYQIVAHIVDYGKKLSISGTAFFVRMPDDRYFLVTNRHVLDPVFEKGLAASHQELVDISVNGFSLDLRRFTARIGSMPQIKFSRDPIEDIAAIHVKTLQSFDTSGTVSINAIPFDQLADDSYFALLSPGDFVSMPGFPEWHDRIGHRPILRSGTLASDPMEEYSGPNQLQNSSRRLIEAFSFGGSSGSPVFAIGLGFDGSGALTSSNYRPLKLIGINAGHLRLTGDGDHSGLSYMFTSTAICGLLTEA